MATTHFKQLISADSHVMEPPDLWWNALGAKFGDRTPRMLDEYKGEKGSFFYSGYLGSPVQRVRIALSSQTEAAAYEAEERGMGAVGYDPEVRVKFQVEAGIDAEVMNPTTMLGLMRNPDVPVLQACSEVFNDWLAEFVSYSPKRLIGISTIPMHDVDWAVNELARTLNKGLNSPMINCQPPEGCPPYRNPVYDKFWAAAEEAGVPITLHILTGKVVDALFLARMGQTPEETSANPGLWIDLFIEAQTVLANDFIYGGILDRFPNLKVLCSEFEVSWIPGFMSRLDQIEDVAPRLNLPKLKMKAKDYMKTRVFHGFIDDTAAELAIPYVGADRILWGSDFPHIRSIGLDAQSTLYQQLQTFSVEDQAKLVGGNAAKVFNLN
jgi:predicted TIM-barrel fold metal-dependent hydrolase